MTYPEFSKKWIELGHETTMPSYETFILHNGQSPKRTYAQVLQGITETW
jgi:hypothetical protein